MKILLAQAEIAQIVQQALVSYISERLVISDGTSIQVTMTDDGATIDLVQTGELKLSVVKKAPKAVEGRGTLSDVKAADRKRDAKIEAPTVAETVTETSETDTVPFEVEEIKAEEVAALTEIAATESTIEPEAEAVEEEAAEVATPPVRSLFANLRKPVN
jgi:hypothetical protein